MCTDRNKKSVFFASVFVMLAAVSPAVSIPSGSYATFGIYSAEAVVPAGSIISDASLVIYGLTPADAAIDVYLLNKPRPGFEIAENTQPDSAFADYGTQLNGAVQNGIYICQFGTEENNSTESTVWNGLPNPFVLKLTGGQTVSYTSAELELIDYVGASSTFGIGIESTDGRAIEFSAIKLRITVSAYKKTKRPVADKTYTFTHCDNLADAQSAYALEFDGLDDYAQINYTAPINTFTVAAWVKANEEHEIDIESANYRSTDGRTGQKYLFAPTPYSRADLNYYLGLGISVGTNGVSVYEHAVRVAPAVAVYQGDLGTDWNHIAVTYANRQAMIYVNGVLVHVGQISRLRSVRAPSVLGGCPLGGFNGKISGVAVWNTALTAGDIMAVAGDQNGVTTPLAQWDFDEGFGTMAFDCSGSGIQALLHGTRWATLGDDIPETEIALIDTPVIDATTNEYVLGLTGRRSFATLNYDPPANNFTVSAWVKATAKHQLDKQNITGGAGRSGQKYVFAPARRGGTLDMTNGGMGLSVGTNGISVYEYYHRTAPALAVYRGELGTDWNHITVTYTDKQPRIYLNGVLVYIGFQSVQNDIYAPTNIGGNGLGYFKGQIANVCVWDRPLNAQEIAMAAGDNVFTLNPLAVWLLDEGIGGEIFDCSGNELTGALNNAFWAAL